MPTLRKTNDPILHVEAKHCPAKLSAKIIADLQEIYHNPPWGGCVGMAAPQIGYPYNVFVAMGEPFVNVKSVKGVGEPINMSEGCFSVPHEVHTVKRYRSIMVEVGNKVIGYSGYMAEVIQHEYDHCRGILICDHSTR